jgi:NAD(P)-dependent dehydrogenase (short-subunit alcohol dehydrogenase family)
MSRKGAVLVTGASGGIGQVTALELARRGWDVVGTVRSPAKGASLQDAAARQGLHVRTVQLDVTDAAQCAEVVGETIGMVGELSALVNNAGHAQTGAIEDVSDEEALAQLQLNLLAPARLSRLLLPHFRERGGGRIVNMSSMAGRFTLPLAGWYSASKQGLEAISDALRLEGADFGVRVILIEPGSFRTDIWARGSESFPDPAYPGYAKAYERSALITGNQRLMPDPIWVARTVAHALSTAAPRARYLLGADALTGVVATAVLPTVVTDAVKGAALGLNAARILWPGKRTTKDQDPPGPP